MVAVTTDKPDTQKDGEERFVLYGVPWSAYVAFRDALDDRAGLKMTYLRGALELMSSSTLHEDAKTIIARLIEVWAMERDVDLRGFGGVTFRREAKERGLEPDECYKLGSSRRSSVPARTRPSSRRRTRLYFAVDETVVIVQPWHDGRSRAGRVARYQTT